MWAGHGPIDLRRALAVSCNPYFEWVGEQLGYETIQRYAHLLGLGEPSGINLTGETAGCVPAFVRPEAVGHLSSHAAGIATSARAARGARLGDGQRRRRAAAAGQRARRTSSPASAGGCRRRRGSTASPRASPARSTRAAPARRSTPTSRSPGKTGHLLAARLVRVLRPGRHPGAGGRRLPAARQRPRRLRRGRPHLPRAVRRRPRAAGGHDRPPPAHCRYDARARLRSSPAPARS